MNSMNLMSIPGARALTAMVASAALCVTLVSTASAQPSVAAGCLSWADEASVVFCRGGADGASELFERTQDGAERQITNLGAVIGSADVSPDGSLVTFHATFAGSSQPQIYVIPRFGTRASVVAAGSAIIHIEPTSVMVGGTPIEVPGAQIQRLTPVGSNVEPRFTPDGTRIGFVSDRLGAPSLWTMRNDGSDQHELVLASID